MLLCLPRLDDNSRRSHSAIRIVLSVIITAVSRHTHKSPENLYTGELTYNEFKENMLQRFDPDAPANLRTPLPPPKSDRQTELDAEMERLSELKKK
ncbi:hypothetical protein SARC_13171 [Sphaeroforma arctica JP610]|uniref:Uncharacterized protein n=1 Tax=Sphaeroforma arctica JP610 TaxID=667725 RepID=A0A0L0FCS5_9EUKA|nr:hypothetical protein SARC_13171 [Sphaeroforma arctica JP610]KNC74276.1 hypothetical protein SARC_13171 [Sphaeroforma arctica JP610]|eukprot:XP_014148178.1 hypothetical protein SARC_13171 [Sphaeroforma arctica JP610]